MLRLFTRRFAGAVVLFAVLVLVGTVGYVIIEDAPAMDAFYMAVITLTAVGYQEVFPLGPAGRSFTVGLLLGGISWMGIWFAFITSFLVELDLQDVIRRRRLVKELARLEGHTIICGGGRTGRKVAQELEDQESPYVVIEVDPTQIRTLREYLPDARVIEGDATHDAVLADAGIERAQGLVACLSADAENLFVVLSARNLGADLTIVARAYEEDTMTKMYLAGADHAVSPNVSGAIRMASVLLRPSVVSFLDIATRGSSLDLRIEEAGISPDSELANRTLAQARIPQKTGLIVIALRKRPLDDDDHGFLFNPDADTLLEAGDGMIVLGQDAQIERLRGYLGN